MRAGGARFVVAGLFALTSLVAAPNAGNAIVPMTRDDIIAKAATGVGSPYWWGHSCWKSWARSWGGADCSGFVARVWNVPTERASDYNCSYHPYSTWNFKYESWHWSNINRANALRGDAMVRRVGDSGHIVIYASGDPWGCSELYEAQCTACGIRHQNRCLDSTYVARRRDNLLTCAPATEVCDGIDNDCDGSVDEGNLGGGASCASGVPGVCGPGVTACVGGSMACVSLTAPSAETCDGLDEDCDGSVDEGNPGGGNACSTGLPGVCASGETACSSAGVGCVQLVAASAETCDGLDNDCDGPVDEGVCHDSVVSALLLPPSPVACAGYDIELTFANTGTSTWSTADGFALHRIAGVLESPEWVDLPATVEPGEAVTFVVPLLTGLQEGVHPHQWCVARNGACFGATAEGTLDVAAPLYRAELLDAGYPQALEAEETGAAWVIVRNIGSDTWPAYGVVLGTAPVGERSPVWTDQWEAYDVAAYVTEDVPPGATTRISFEVGCFDTSPGLLSTVFELRTPTGEAFYCRDSGLEFGITALPSPPVAAPNATDPGGAPPPDGPISLSGACSLSPAGRARDLPGAGLYALLLLVVVGSRFRSRDRG